MTRVATSQVSSTAQVWANLIFLAASGLGSGDRRGVSRGADGRRVGGRRGGARLRSQRAPPRPSRHHQHRSKRQRRRSHPVQRGTGNLATASCSAGQPHCGGLKDHVFLMIFYTSEVFRRSDFRITSTRLRESGASRCRCGAVRGRSAPSASRGAPRRGKRRTTTSARPPASSRSSRRRPAPPSRSSSPTTLSPRTLRCLN